MKMNIHMYIHVYYRTTTVYKPDVDWQTPASLRRNPNCSVSHGLVFLKHNVRCQTSEPYNRAGMTIK